MSDAYHDPRSPMNPARAVGAPASAPVRPPMPPPTPEPARAADLVRPADLPLRRPSELTDPCDTRRRNASAQCRSRHYFIGRYHFLRETVDRGQRRGQFDQLPRSRDRRERPVQGFHLDREAEVRGRFEGDLTVRKRLLIKSTGRVSGTVRYGQIEIETAARFRATSRRSRPVNRRKWGRCTSCSKRRARTSAKPSTARGIDRRARAQQIIEYPARERQDFPADVVTCLAF